MSELSSTLAGKRDRLLELLRSYGSCAVAFSGGLDSAVGQGGADGPGRPRRGRHWRQRQPGGRRTRPVPRTRPADRHPPRSRSDRRTASPGYAANAPDRCYFCKAELFLQVEKLAERLGVAVVADGSNSDDRGEHRPGLRAARQRKVRSPLAECGLTKAEIRQLAAAWGLPVWNKPATPCLSSRIAYGEPVTPERLAMIDQAEAFLRERGFQPLRVRYHKGDMARIEVSPDALARFLDAEFRRETIERLKSLGFKYVSLDLEGFRSGSLNAVVPMERLEVAGRRPETPPPSGAAAGQRPS